MYLRRHVVVCGCVCARGCVSVLKYSINVYTPPTSLSGSSLSSTARELTGQRFRDLSVKHSQKSVPEYTYCIKSPYRGFLKRCCQSIQVSLPTLQLLVSEQHLQDVLELVNIEHLFNLL
jgi:hypothetical protein